MRQVDCANMEAIISAILNLFIFFWQVQNYP